MRSVQQAVKVNLRSFKEFVAKNFDEATLPEKVMIVEGTKFQGRSRQQSSMYG